MNIKRLKTQIAFMLMRIIPMKRQRRKTFAKVGGVNIKNKALIGRNVSFDTMFPEKIIIDNNVHIADGVVFLTHYLDTKKEKIAFVTGTIEIGENTFIGTNTIICKPVSIGKNCIVGAGSVVTKNIPDNEIWAGNPARFIKKRQ